MRYALAVLLLFAVIISAYLVGTHFVTESRDEKALAAHYALQGREVDILESVEWPSYETCFRVALRGPGAAERSERVVMLSALAEDNPYEFSGEYETLGACQAHFNRG